MRTSAFKFCSELEYCARQVRIVKKLLDKTYFLTEFKGETKMDLKNYSTGVQHIGIPTNDIDKTVDFYHKLGFETAFETVNEEADEKVVFLKLGTLVVETYENHAAVLRVGAIDHVALDVKDIEEIYQYINQAGLNTTQDSIHFLPFWENGVKFFTIEGPNKEKVEFSQYL